MGIAWLRTEQAAVYLTERGLKRSPKTLAKERVIGGGPEFSYMGHTPVYAPEKLDEHIKDRLIGPCKTTSDPRRRLSDPTARLVEEVQR